VHASLQVCELNSLAKDGHNQALNSERAKSARRRKARNKPSAAMLANHWEAKMQTPDNLAGRITEEIMLIFSRFDDVAEVALPVDKYNLVYSHIYSVLDKRLPNKPLHSTPKAEPKCSCHPHDLVYYGCRCK